MQMLSFFAAAAVISLAPPSAAETGGTSSFEHQGFTYVYKVTQKEGGRVIAGKRYPDGARFTLRLRDGRVRGISNGVPVHFYASDAKGAAETAKPTTFSMR